MMKKLALLIALAPIIAWGQSTTSGNAYLPGVPSSNGYGTSGQCLTSNGAFPNLPSFQTCGSGGLPSIAADSILSNNTGSSAAPTANTSLPSGMTTSAGGTVVGSSDTVTLTNKDSSSLTNTVNLGRAINIAGASYGAKADMVIASRTVSITSGQSALTATGASFTAADVGKMISVEGAGVTPTATGVTITGTAGQFACTCTGLAVGQSLTISGTYGGTGSITGYTNPTTYYVSATDGVSTFTLVSAGGNGTALVTTAGTPTGLTYTLPAQPLVTTIASYTNATHVGLTATAGTTVSATSKLVAYGTDNATAIGNAITAATAANVPIYVPSNSSSCFGYTAPLTISATNLRIVGDYVSENSNNGINGPLGTPALIGSVLCPSPNGSDAIDITGTSPSIDIENIGILFQTAFVNTGHGIDANPPNTSSTNEVGLIGSLWNNVKVYGHDGNHYAFYQQNPINNTMLHLTSYGGGGIYVNGTSHNGKNYGNTTFIDAFLQAYIGGKSNVINISAGASSALNLITFIRPQAFTDSGWCTQAVCTSNPVQAAQNTLYVDTNTKWVRVLAPDFETSVGSSAVFSNPGGTNVFDAQFGLVNNQSQPDWGTQGFYGGGQNVTVTNTTSSGTVAIEATQSVPPITMNAASATTVTNLTSLYVPLATAGTNVTATNQTSITAQGNISSSGLYNFGGSLNLWGNTSVILGNFSNSGTGLLATADANADYWTFHGNSGNQVYTVPAGTDSNINEVFKCKGTCGLQMNPTGGANVAEFNSAGWFKLGNDDYESTTVPTVTSGGGTSPSVLAANTAIFVVTEGSTGTPSATLVMGMPTTANYWICYAQDESSSSITARQTSIANNAVTITFSAAPSNSDKIGFMCGST